MDGLADALVSGAAAEIARHGGVDVGVGRFRFFREQRSGAHDLSGLAIAALGDVEVTPGLLDGTEFSIRGETLDGGDFFLPDR